MVSRSYRCECGTAHFVLEENEDEVIRIICPRCFRWISAKRYYEDVETTQKQIEE